MWEVEVGYPTGRDLAAVIKSAASAASRNPRGAQPPAVVRLPGRRPWAPLGFLKAALAADLITASPNPSGEAALAADLITATPKLPKITKKHMKHHKKMNR